MDLFEIRKRRSVLEDVIFAEILRFQNETGTRVEAINVVHHAVHTVTSDKPTWQLTAVNADIRI